MIYDVKPGPAATVSAVHVEDFDGILPPLATRIGAAPGGGELEADVRTLTRALEESGHSDARVESVVPEGGGTLPVVFRARPGPRSVIDDLRGRFAARPGRGRRPVRAAQPGRANRTGSASSRRTGTRSLPPIGTKAISTSR